MLARMPAENPFYAPSPLPYELPPFDEITDEHWLPAFERGIAEQRAEVAAIASDPAASTVPNTLVALERSGRLLARVWAAFRAKSSADTNERIQQVDAEIAPKLAGLRDDVVLDGALFARLEALLAGKDSLEDQDCWLLERYHSDFVHAGARLDAAAKERLRELNQELASLQTTFEKYVLDETNAAAVVVDDREQLAGLSEDAIAGAAEAAAARGLAGKYLLTLILPSDQPALVSLQDRGLREQIFRASTGRNAQGNGNDTRATLLRQVALRAERARLLGFDTHAAYVTSDNMAGTAEAVTGMLGRLAPAAVANAHREADALQEQIVADGGDFTLQAWDWAYYLNRVRSARYELDAAALRPYFELDRVLHDGLFFAANRLYGITFRERTDLPTYHSDVRVFEVFEENGEPLALYLADFFTRDSKRGGAWMDSLVDQSELLGTKPIVTNTLNITAAPAGEPTLLSFDEVTTMFHEFGHALHGMLSKVRYPRFSGTSVPIDFVEFPSQVNEMWSVWPEVLANYAKHYQTGEPLDPKVVQRLLDSRQWGEGFATTEYLAASLLDFAWHSVTPEDEVTDVEKFELDALTSAGIHVDTIPARYRSPYFAHIFTTSYSAAYYSYIWSEVLDADTVEWFKENGGLSRAAGEHFRRELLGRGGSIDSAQAYRNFRGRDAWIEPLLKRRGLDQKAP